MLGIGGENLEGFYSIMKYFQSQDNPNNKAFVAAFKEMWGEDSVIGDVTQAAYLGPWLWKAAVEKAGSFDVDKVVAASEEGDIELTMAPEGRSLCAKFNVFNVNKPVPASALPKTVSKAWTHPFSSRSPLIKPKCSMCYRK